MKLLIMGAQGSGKGTACEKLTQMLKIPAISTGDCLRKIIASGSALGQTIKKTIDAGGLVSDELMLKVLKEQLSSAECKNGYILDGYPRNMAQAKMLESIADIDKAILLNAPREVVIERISGRRTCPKCGHIHNIKFAGNGEYCSECGEKYVVRSDDTPESVNKRLDIFYSETYPIAQYYRSKGKLLEVDAGKNPEYTLEQIVKGLEKQK